MIASKRASHQRDHDTFHFVQPTASYLGIDIFELYMDTNTHRGHRDKARTVFSLP